MQRLAGRPRPPRHARAEREVLTNGNAEAGTTGWSVFGSGSLVREHQCGSRRHPLAVEITGGRHRGTAPAKM